MQRKTSAQDTDSECKSQELHTELEIWPLEEVGGPAASFTDEYTYSIPHPYATLVP